MPKTASMTKKVLIVDDDDGCGQWWGSCFREWATHERVASFRALSRFRVSV